MLVATFGPTTEWVGKTITREGDTIILEGHGPISALDVMVHDRQGHLTWASNGTRAWVGSLTLVASDAQPSAQDRSATSRSVMKLKRSRATKLKLKQFGVLLYSFGYVGLFGCVVIGCAGCATTNGPALQISVIGACITVTMLIVGIVICTVTGADVP